MIHFYNADGLLNRQEGGIVAPGAPGTGTSGPGIGGPSAGITGVTAVTPSTELDSGRVVLRRLNKDEYNNTCTTDNGQMTDPTARSPTARRSRVWLSSRTSS